MGDSFEDEFEAQIEAQSAIQKVKKEIDDMLTNRYTTFCINTTNILHYNIII
jgi:hypothetical protein